MNKRVKVLVPEGTAYGGTLGALYKYLEIQERSGQLSDDKNILVLSADHLYGMDYSKFIAFHENNDSDITVAVHSIPSDQAYRFGVIKKKGKVINSFVEKLTHRLKSSTCQISMGIYIFKVSALKKIKNNQLSGMDIGGDAIPFAVGNEKIKVCGYDYEDFWLDVGEEVGVWEASFANREDVLEIKKLVHRNYIHMPTEAWPAEIHKPTTGLCRIENGSIIKGSIKDSVISNGCYVGPDVELDKCVIFKNTILTGKTTIKNTLIGSAVYGTNFQFGIEADKDIEEYRRYFYDSDGMPYPYVGKFGFIPAGESFNVTVPYDELHKEVFGY